MRIVTAVALASAMAFMQASAGAANTTTIDEFHHDELSTNSMSQNLQSDMFDGIQLTEVQRRHLRDLMQQARHELFQISVDDAKNMQRLITADIFNEVAIREQVEKIARAQVEQRIVIARVRNQMYHLLTPAQQHTLHKNFEQRLNELRKSSDLQTSSLQVLSSNNTPQQ